VSELYHQGSRELQDRFDTRRLADRIEQRLVLDRIGDDDKAFIESLDMFFLATADEDNQPSCSYKGGEPGFVRVVDPCTLAFPTYDGNGMFLSMGNVSGNRRVGLLFIDFLRPKRLRISGEASIRFDDPLLPAYPEAQFVVRVAVTRVFPNCPRYIHKHALVERSSFVPRADCATPVPSWKKSDWASDVLPENDPARVGPDSSGQDTTR
jgi:predicted pyridoxine 5'-phosphate oxidase superfamily flavin-nucleotide-binding protein